MRKITFKMLAFVVAFFMSQSMMAQVDILFEEHFEDETLGSFKVEGDNGLEDTPVWRWDAEFNTVIADAFNRIENIEYESVLVSPAIQLGANNIVTFDHSPQMFTNMNDISVCVREAGTAKWTKISEKFTELYELTNAGDIAIPTELEGKSIELGFRYKAADAQSGGLWAIGNIFVKGEKMAVEASTLFEEHFDEENLCSFHVEGDNGPEDNPIWKWDSYCNSVRADAYYKFEGIDYESFLVSPVIELGTENIITFDHLTEFFTNLNDLALCVREAGSTTWTKISEKFAEAVPMANAGDIAVPTEFDGKSVEFGFRYRAADSQSAGIWGIDNVIVKGVKKNVEKKDPKIFYEYKEAVAILGQAFKAPALINPNGVEIVYSTDNADVATVDEKTGVVTIVSEGMANITATSIENADYISATTSFALTVKQGSSSEVILEEYFDTSLGGFTVEGENGSADAPIWYVDSGCARADGYGKFTGAVTNYLVSPEITLATGDNSVNFVYYFSNYAGTSVDQQMGLSVREIGGEWEDLTIPECKESGELISSGDIQIPAAYAGKKVQIGFKYYAETSLSAGVWGIDEVIVKGANGGASEKKDPQISFPKDEYVYVIGTGDFDAPVVNNPNNVKVVYSSSNTDMADVDAESGFVMMYDLGSVEIIATSVETEEFKSVSVSYTLIVTDTPPTGIDGIFADEVKAGKVYDIQGRRVNKLGKGLYIVNGKKVIIK